MQDKELYPHIHERTLARRKARPQPSLLPRIVNEHSRRGNRGSGKDCLRRSDWPTLREEFAGYRIGLSSLGSQCVWHHTRVNASMLGTRKPCGWDNRAKAGSGGWGNLPSMFRRPKGTSVMAFPRWRFWQVHTFEYPNQARWAGTRSALATPARRRTVTQTERADTNAQPKPATRCLESPT